MRSRKERRMKIRARANSHDRSSLRRLSATGRFCGEGRAGVQNCKTNPRFVRNQRLRPGWLCRKTQKFACKGRKSSEKRRKIGRVSRSGSLSSSPGGFLAVSGFHKRKEAPSHGDIHLALPLHRRGHQDDQGGAEAARQSE